MRLTVSSAFACRGACGETPSALDLLRAPVIEDWSTEVRRRGKEFVLIVKGEARRHPDFRDGDPIGSTPAPNY